MHPVLSHLAAYPCGALIALDFDGTLAPIVTNPADSRPVHGVVDTLTCLADAGMQIAIVTGRDAGTVLTLGRLAPIPGLVVSGLHGAERWQGGQLVTRDEPPGIAALRDLLPPLLHQVDPEVWLEDKRLSLVVHTRPAADPAGALLRLAPAVTALAAAHGLEVHPGKLVHEIRIPDLSKADALRLLLTDDTTAALFAGDDVGDLPAFDAIGQWSQATGRPGITVAVGEVPAVQDAAELRLESPAELARTLAELLAS